MKLIEIILIIIIIVALIFLFVWIDTGNFMNVTSHFLQVV